MRTSRPITVESQDEEAKGTTSSEMLKYATFTIQDSNQSDFMMIPSYVPPT